MPRIKGWKKIFMKGYNHFWRNEYDKTIEVGVTQLEFSGKWMWFLFKQGLWNGQKEFKSEVQALRFAINWMRKVKLFYKIDGGDQRC